jgi:hypothetical protein
LATPGFLETGIDFEQLIAYYLSNNCRIEITDPAEIKLIVDIMKRVISTSYGYKEGSSDFVNTVHGRMQMIFNSSLQELSIKKAGLVKRSDTIWSLDDAYEKGTDFQSYNGKQIEAKVYKTWSNMLYYAEKGATDYTVFHGADYVLCYLIDKPSEKEQEYQKHWYWLKKINGKYVVYIDEALCNITACCLSSTLPICYCQLKDNKLVIGKNTFCVL